MFTQINISIYYRRFSNLKSETKPSIIKELVENYSLTELRNELRARQVEKMTKAKPGKKRGLISTRGVPSSYSTREVHEAYKSAEKLVYGVDD